MVAYRKVMITLKRKEKLFGNFCGELPQFTCIHFYTVKCGIKYLVWWFTVYVDLIQYRKTVKKVFYISRELCHAST